MKLIIFNAIINIKNILNRYVFSLTSGLYDKMILIKRGIFMCKKFISALISLTLAFSVYALNNDYNYTGASVTANPVISRNCPAYSDSGSTQGANDEHYFSFWNAPVGSYLAYDLSEVPDDMKKEVIAVWYNTTGAYDYTVLEYQSSMSCPSDYTLEINKAPGGEYPEDGWETAAEIKDNTCHSRQHVVSMEGYNWIRISITGADGKTDGQVSIQMDIHSVSDGVSDSWIFYGDSITACGMHNCYGTGFATYVNMIDDRYFPVQENGGIGGITSTHGASRIDEWLSYFPGKYVSVAYGTNDSWGNQTGAEKYYANTKYMIDKILECGKTPVLPTIPFSLEPGISQYVEDYNAMIEKLYDEYPEIIKGPDFYSIFMENPDYLSADGVHPNDSGYDMMRKTWASVMYETVYSNDSTTPDENQVKGDINADGTVNCSDLTELADYLTGKNEKAVNNADMNNDSKINILDFILLKNLLMK